MSEADSIYNMHNKMLRHTLHFRAHGRLADGLLVALVSAVLLAIFGGLMVQMANQPDTITLYCAVGLMPPVEELTRTYEQQHSVHIRIQPANSGALLAQIQLDSHGDLYLPADDSFVAMASEKELVARSIPLVNMRLVLAVNQGNPKKIQSLDDLLRQDVYFGIAFEQAAAGRKTREMLAATGRWNQIKSSAKVSKPTVTEVAQDVQIGSVDAAFIWDATAYQFGLEIIPIPELASADAQVAIALLRRSSDPDKAMRFVDYLASSQHARDIFTRYHYQTIRRHVLPMESKLP